jgi:DNA polymerase III delta prime subunit
VFENIIGQTGVIDTLRRELETGVFPASVLIHGPAFSGKLSTALEIARVLTCQERAAWSCGCPSCRKQRLLVQPNTVLMGVRYFELEIAASADTLRRNPRTASQYLFIRAVRKLTRRFDPFLWEGEETAVRGLQSVLTEVEEELDQLLPTAAGELRLEGKKLEQKLSKLQDLCRRLAGALSAETIPINQIRRAAAWLHLSALGAPAGGGRGARKVLILENADRMYEASSNSLLKLLEERTPPCCCSPPARVP